MSQFSGKQPEADHAGGDFHHGATQFDLIAQRNLFEMAECSG